jgi:histidine triad (HIT) family protein
MTDCIFCKIIAGEMSGEILYQDDRVTAFKDINPAAPVHVLVVPNRHIPSVRDAEADDRELLGDVLLTARQVAEEQEILDSGFRLIINNGPDAHQEVPHLHVHLLGGQRMRHPMG